MTDETDAGPDSAPSDPFRPGGRGWWQAGMPQPVRPKEASRTAVLLMVAAERSAEQAAHAVVREMDAFGVLVTRPDRRDLVASAVQEAVATVTPELAATIADALRLQAPPPPVSIRRVAR